MSKTPTEMANEVYDIINPELDRDGYVILHHIEEAAALLAAWRDEAVAEGIKMALDPDNETHSSWTGNRRYWEGRIQAARQPSAPEGVDALKILDEASFAMQTVNPSDLAWTRITKALEGIRNLRALLARAALKGEG